MQIKIESRWGSLEVKKMKSLTKMRLDHVYANGYANMYVIVECESEAEEQQAIERGCELIFESHKKGIRLLERYFEETKQNVKRLGIEGE